MIIYDVTLIIKFSKKLTQKITLLKKNLKFENSWTVMGAGTDLYPRSVQKQDPKFFGLAFDRLQSLSEL